MKWTALSVTALIIGWVIAVIWFFTVAQAADV
jgi:hypothetical protein